MKYDFTTKLSRKEKGSLKWEDMYQKKHDVNHDIVPLSVADMEFKTAPEIIQGLKEFLNDAVLGYTTATEYYKNIVCSWMKNKHNFDIKNEWIVNTAGVVPALFNAISEFTNPGDGVIIMTPVYYPFFKVIQDQGRKIVECPLIESNETYSINYSLFEKLAKDETNKILLFCSPHNPVGRVWKREELEKLSDIIIKNKILLFSDEIHFDLIMSNFTHTVFQTINEELADKTITFTSPSKSFNLAGMGISNIIIKNKNLRNRFVTAINKKWYVPFSILGYKACELAYQKGENWLNECLKIIEENRNYCINFFKQKYPQIKVYPNEGTYLLWIDFRQLNMSNDELENFMINKAELFLDEGYIFGKNGEGFERINIAIPKSVLKTALERLDIALKNYKKSL